TSEFGEIHVDTWEARVVQISAKVIVGAESASVAEEISRAINVSVTESENAVHIRPILPDHRDMGDISMQVNLFITVPRNAQVDADNFFGDTYIRGVEGRVAIESQYGIVDLADLDAPVSARLRGEFPVRVLGLEQGGHFQLHGSSAEFGQIAGPLQISSFGGSIVVDSLEENAELDIVSESGSVALVLSPESAPDLTASTRYGTIASELPVARSEQGARILVRHGSPDARQRIDISGTFSDIQIRYEGGGSASSQRANNTDKPIPETIREHVVVTPYTKIKVEGLIGDIQLEGTDEPGVHITATRMVWVPSASKAPAALEALALRVDSDSSNDRLQIRTVLTADMAALQCSQYRVNLEIRYPKRLPMTVEAEEGHTQIRGNVASVHVEQTVGDISALDFGGPITLVNKNGGVRVTGGTGAVSVEVRYGDTRFDRVQGAISVVCVQGDTIIDSPGAGVTVRNNLGNVRILALGGVKGDYDVLVEEGDLRLALGALPAANLNVAVDGGTVDSVYPLPGQILGRRKEEFRNIVGEGAYSMKLEARNGDIVLD
ncbi:MAG: hypothetical protein L3K26_03075, partial [Candidatus Hydrogenedentes bacterium]|nr:hypothetical protein [Candidatus Hydrogenedentota bacterium]